jgi:hypothetical protein
MELTNNLNACYVMYVYCVPCWPATYGTCRAFGMLASDPDPAEDGGMSGSAMSSMFSIASFHVIYCDG